MPRAAPYRRYRDRRTSSQGISAHRIAVLSPSAWQVSTSIPPGMPPGGDILNEIRWLWRTCEEVGEPSGALLLLVTGDANRLLALRMHAVLLGGEPAMAVWSLLRETAAKGTAESRNLLSWPRTPRPHSFAPIISGSARNLIFPSTTSAMSRGSVMLKALDGLRLRGRSAEDGEKCKRSRSHRATWADFEFGTNM
jgi:hypothetical protein